MAGLFGHIQRRPDERRADPAALALRRDRERSEQQRRRPPGADLDMPIADRADNMVTLPRDQTEIGFTRTALAQLGDGFVGVVRSERPGDQFTYCGGVLRPLMGK